MRRTPDDERVDAVRLVTQSTQVAPRDFAYRDHP
jgi:hypothetical protein